MLYRVQSTAIGQSGLSLRLLPGATVTVRDKTGAIAIIYADSLGLSPINNPAIASATGGYDFYVVPDDYYDVSISSSGSAVDERIYPLSSEQIAAGIAAANAAELAAASIKALTANATTLGPGSTATAAYDHMSGVMEFGIPTGAQGPQGDIGPTGAQGLKGDTGDASTAPLWAESPTAPGDPGTKSAKSHAADALASATAAALYDGPRFGTIALMQAGAGFADGKFIRVDQAANGEQEGFVYDAASTLTADGALIVAATGMGVGRLISTRTVYATVAEMLADGRTLPLGTILTVQGIGDYTTVASGTTGAMSFTGPSGNYVLPRVRQATGAAWYGDDISRAIAHMAAKGGGTVVVDQNVTVGSTIQGASGVALRALDDVTITLGTLLVGEAAMYNMSNTTGASLVGRGILDAADNAKYLVFAEAAIDPEVSEATLRGWHYGVCMQSSISQAIVGLRSRRLRLINTAAGNVIYPFWVNQRSSIGGPNPTDIEIDDLLIDGGSRGVYSPSNQYTADMLSLHGVHGARVRRPRLINGGECGLTIAYDCDGIFITSPQITGCDGQGYNIGSGNHAIGVADTSVYAVNDILSCTTTGRTAWTAKVNFITSSTRMLLSNVSTQRLQVGDVITNGVTPSTVTAVLRSRNIYIDGHPYSEDNGLNGGTPVAGLGHYYIQQAENVRMSKPTGKGIGYNGLVATAATFWMDGQYFPDATAAQQINGDTIRYGLHGGGIKASVSGGGALSGNNGFAVGYPAAVVLASAGTYTFTFAIPMADANYSLALESTSAGGSGQGYHFTITARSTTGFTVTVRDNVSPYTLTNVGFTVLVQ